MTLLTVVKDVCAATGVMVPSSVFSGINSNRTMQEMLALATEMAQRIAYDTRDWGRLKTNAVFTGDGVSSTFTMPANYQRMLLTSNVWRSTSQQQPMKFIPDTDQWLTRRVANATNSAWGEWTLMGDQMHIWPVLRGPVYSVPPADLVLVSPAETAYFAYLDKNCIALASGGYGSEFMADGDTFVLGDRLLKLGMIWQWKASKGSPYAEDMGSYSDALANAMGHDGPSPIIVGRAPVSGGLHGSY